ncbi:uncharacterized protein LOC127787610 [Diospyros lotus]|uniref:uncharacterized protein LOC127787610 n=1 Tax=Diospyros lotus TaxID=55363 RepID=UPI0022528BA3|nr:uncharacterized protein LOC127787610 [Diospyros lotus]
MEVHLKAQDLWEATEQDYEVVDLPTNPTMNQIKIHKERKTRKAKTMAYLCAAISPNIFTKIMNLSSAKTIWDHLKEEYQGNERVKNMQVLNLIREFEMQRMKESETVKEYIDMLLSLANKLRLLELLNALQAQKQRRLVRIGEAVEGALQAQTRPTGEKKAWNHNKKLANTGNNNSGNYPPCPYCKKTNHPQHKCWWRPNVKCNKCDQLGHITIVCISQQQEGEARVVADQHEDDELF